MLNVLERPADDFALAATPNGVTVPQKGLTSTSLGTTLVSGSPQSVTFTADGLPAGVTAMFDPPTLTVGASSTLTLTSAAAAVGTYTVTITATGASATHTTTVSLQVTAGGSGGSGASGCGCTIGASPAAGSTNVAGSVALLALCLGLLTLRRQRIIRR
jgi:MYXO-CTERM domain-containing protein